MLPTIRRMARRPSRRRDGHFQKSVVRLVIAGNDLEPCAGGGGLRRRRRGCADLLKRTSTVDHEAPRSASARCGGAENLNTRRPLPTVPPPLRTTPSSRLAQLDQSSPRSARRCRRSHARCRRPVLLPATAAALIAASPASIPARDAQPVHPAYRWRRRHPRMLWPDVDDLLRHVDGASRHGSLASRSPATPILMLHRRRDAGPDGRLVETLHFQHGAPTAPDTLVAGRTRQPTRSSAMSARLLAANQPVLTLGFVRGSDGQATRATSPTSAAHRRASVNLATLDCHPELRRLHLTCAETRPRRFHLETAIPIHPYSLGIIKTAVGGHRSEVRAPNVGGV